jgi:predicted AAA+ superfamily ATPase
MVYYETLYIYPVEVYSRSAKQRQVNPRKIYTIVTGLLNAVSLGMTRDRGRFSKIVFT